MSEQLRVWVRPRTSQEQPGWVFLRKDNEEDEEDPEDAYIVQDLPLALTDSPQLAEWLVGAINAHAEGISWDSPRPGGRILERGYFTCNAGEFGRFYCVAWSLTGYLIHEDPRQRKYGFTVVESRDRSLIQGTVDQMNELIDAEPPDETLCEPA